MINKFEEEKIERIKERTKPADARPLLKLFINKDLSSKERMEMVDSIKKSSEKVGYMLLERAFIEKDITEEEWKKMQKKYGFESIDMATLLQAYFNKKDGLLEKRKPIVISTGDSKIYKYRTFIRKRFGVKILNPEEGLKLIKKAEKEEKKR